MAKWLLVDGYNMAFRAFYGMPELTRADGFPTGALHGWVKTLWRLQDQEKPDGMLVFFDLGGSQDRLSLHPEYKAQRKETPEPLEKQIPVIKDLTRAMGLVGIELDGVESDDLLASQARLTRDLQDDLLRTRMVEFESLADRLYRVVRQAAKETGKQVRLDIVGGAIELDRGVLDRMTASFEHLLRNCVTHGIEDAPTRVAAGKDPVGSIVVALQHERNEVAVEFRDDGAGLNLARIHERGASVIAGPGPHRADQRRRLRTALP